MVHLHACSTKISASLNREKRAVLLSSPGVMFTKIISSANGSLYIYDFIMIKGEVLVPLTPQKEIVIHIE